ncbi:MAG: hypothetical protein EON96_12290 [Caulobacteraceae bacterium]|nr:MAG: hypothetical protein EON96_12290 [Caulobacteraceae bacterium]
MRNGDLSEAVTLYLGYGSHAWPHRDAGRVTARFGLLKGLGLAAEAKRLDDIVGTGSIDWTVDDLSSATTRVRLRAAEVTPTLSEDALDALAWAFSYDCK